MKKGTILFLAVLVAGLAVIIAVSLHLQKPLDKDEYTYKTELGDNFEVSSKIVNYPSWTQQIHITDTDTLRKLMVLSTEHMDDSIIPIVHYDDKNFYEALRFIVVKDTKNGELYNYQIKDLVEGAVVDIATGSYLSKQLMVERFTPLAEEMIVKYNYTADAYDWLPVFGKEIMLRGNIDITAMLEGVDDAVKASKAGRYRKYNDIINTCKNLIKGDTAPKIDYTGLAVLYNGISLYKADRQQDLNMISAEALNSLKSKYNIEYYTYNGYSFAGMNKGTVEKRGLDYNWEVKFEGAPQQPAVYISKQFDPFPRALQSFDFNGFEKSEAVTTEVNTQFGINSQVKEAVKVDLDGDNTDEYIVIFNDNSNNSYVLCLVDNAGSVVSYMMALVNPGRDVGYSLNDVTVIDVENDGVMEMIANLPVYEGFDFTVYKYDKGNFNKNYINKCSLKPQKKLNK